VLKLKKYFLIDLRKRDDITVSDAMTSAVFYDQAIKNDLLIKIKTSVITIVYGNGVELSEVKAKAEALENESGIPIYYYNDGIETWNSLKDFFKNDEK
jgi:hypothetical protein